MNLSSSRWLWPGLIAALLIVAPTRQLAAQPEAAPADLARPRLEQLGVGLESLQVDFRQRVIDSTGELLEESEGQAWLRRPNHLRWQTGGEFPELIVADGERIWLYDESLQQVTVRIQAGMDADSPLLILTGIERLDEKFQVAELGLVEGLAMLALTPMETDAQFDRILLGFGTEGLQRMVLEDAFGMRTELDFAHLQRNGELDPTLFEFVPPAGVDLVGEVPEGLTEALPEP